MSEILGFSLTAIEKGMATGIRRSRTAITDEKAIQHIAEGVLTDLRYTYTREYRLSPKYRLDFMLWTSAPLQGVALELKKGKMSLADLRQIAFYLEHPQVLGCIVMAMRVDQLPATLLDKPICAIELWKMLL